MEQTIKDFKAYLEKMNMLGQAMRVMSFDNNTIAPKGALVARGKRSGYFAQEMFKLGISPEMKGFLDALEPVKGELDPITFAMYRKAKKNYDNNTKIPPEKIREFAELRNKGNHAWEEARKNDDFDHFAPYLAKMIEMSKEMVEYRRQEGQAPYDVLLDDYEEGMTMEIYDEFFGKLRAVIVPLLKVIVDSGKKADADFMHTFMAKADQEKLSAWIAEKNWI